MTEENKPAVMPSAMVQQQLGVLNLRITDMMRELNATVKLLVDESAALRKENAELKVKAGKKEAASK